MLTNSPSRPATQLSPAQRLLRAAGQAAAIDSAPLLSPVPAPLRGDSTGIPSTPQLLAPPSSHHEERRSALRRRLTAPVGAAEAPALIGELEAVAKFSDAAVTEFVPALLKVARDLRALSALSEATLIVQIATRFIDQDQQSGPALLILRGQLMTERALILIHDAPIAELDQTDQNTDPVELHMSAAVAAFAAAKPDSLPTLLACVSEFADDCYDLCHLGRATVYLEMAAQLAAHLKGDTSLDHVLRRAKLFDCYIASGDPDAARAELKTLSQSVPEESEPSYRAARVTVDTRRAEMHLESRNWSKVIQCVTGTLAFLSGQAGSNPTELSLLYELLGRAQRKLGHYSDAAEHLELARKYEQERTSPVQRYHACLTTELADVYALQWDPEMEALTFASALDKLRAEGDWGAPETRDLLLARLWMARRENEGPEVLDAIVTDVLNHLEAHPPPKIIHIQTLQAVAKCLSSGGEEHQQRALRLLGAASELLGEGRWEYPTLALDLQLDVMYAQTSSGSREGLDQAFDETIQFVQNATGRSGTTTEIKVRLDHSGALIDLDATNEARGELGQIQSLSDTIQKMPTALRAELLFQEALLTDDPRESIALAERALELARQRPRLRSDRRADLYRHIGFTAAEILSESDLDSEDAKSLREKAIGCLSKAERIDRLSLMDRQEAYKETLDALLELHAAARTPRAQIRDLKIYFDRYTRWLRRGHHEE